MQSCVFMFKTQTQDWYLFICLSAIKWISTFPPHKMSRWFLLRWIFLCVSFQSSLMNHMQISPLHQHPPPPRMTTPCSSLWMFWAANQQKANWRRGAIGPPFQRGEVSPPKGSRRQSGYQKVKKTSFQCIRCQFMLLCESQFSFHMIVLQCFFLTLFFYLTTHATFVLYFCIIYIYLYYQNN